MPSAALTYPANIVSTSTHCRQFPPYIETFTMDAQQLNPSRDEGEQWTTCRDKTFSLWWGGRQGCSLHICHSTDQATNSHLSALGQVIDYVVNAIRHTLLYKLQVHIKTFLNSSIIKTCWRIFCEENQIIITGILLSKAKGSAVFMQICRVATEHEKFYFLVS